MTDVVDGRGQTAGSAELSICRRVEALLLRDLQTLLDRPRSSRTRDELLGLLKYLEFNLRHQMNLRGNLAAASASSPASHAPLLRLQRQLNSCRCRLEEIRVQVLLAPEFAPIASEVRTALRRWMKHMLEHAPRQQQRLLQSAFAADFGGAA